MKIPPTNIPPYESYPYENYPREDLPLGKLPPMKSAPHLNRTNERKNRMFCLEESRAIQHPCIMGLDTFFTEWKKSKNQPKAKIAKWHLLASCTSQGELKLGSQIIKFGKYVKLLNSQLSMHITLWILKKANSKMHALHVSTMNTLQICLIGTNLKALAVFSWLFICYFVAIFNQGGAKYRPFF